MKTRSFCQVLALSISLALFGCATNKPLDTVSSIKLAEEAFASQDYQKTLALMMPLAKQGNPQAEYVVGYLYYYGQGIAADSDQAKFWIRKSAEQGHLPAQQALSLINDSESTLSNIG